MDNTLTASPEVHAFSVLTPSLTQGRTEEGRLRPKMRAVISDNWRDLEGYVPDWDDLAGNALEPNAFYESWMLLPALRTLCRTKRMRFVLILGHNAPEASTKSRLYGLFPLELQDRYRGVPLRTLSLLSHAHCFLNTPLVSKNHAGLTVAAFIEWLETSTDCALFQWRRICGDGPFNRLLETILVQRGSRKFSDEDYTRAFFHLDNCSGEYMPEFISGKGRRDLRRRGQRLRELGEVCYSEIGPAESVDWWIETFLTLEASGWKGRQGTALACDVSSREFFDQA